MIIFKKLFKLSIILLFSLYYIIAIALNFPWINAKIEPLILFGAKKFIIINRQIALSTYPTLKDLKLDKKIGYKDIITILDPSFPISRELVRKERKNCQKLDLSFMVMPIDFYAKRSIDYTSVIKMISNSGKKTIIHSYFFDRRLKMLKEIIKKATLPNIQTKLSS